MAYNPNNPNGSAVSASSAPVVIASDQASVSVGMTDTTITGQSAQTATVNNILPVASSSTATTTTGFRSMSVQVNSTGTGGTYIFEGSNDNVTFVTIPVYNQLILTGTPITAAVTASSSNIVYIFPITTQFVRLRIATTITGGSIQAFTRMSPVAWIPPVLQVAQTTAANLATTATIGSGTVTTVTTVTNSQSALPGSIVDVASAAITTTTTAGPFTPTSGSSYQVTIPVTAVSGTTPSMVVQVQESFDAGVTFTTVYTFPAITAIGAYTSPALVLRGNRVQYVQTITGTTPSFTRAVNRYQLSQQNVINPATGLLTDGSTTTSGTPSTSTQIFGTNFYRRYLFIQNTGSTTIWINFTTAAVASQPSIQIVPGAAFVQEGSFVSTEAVNVLSTIASVAFTAKQA